MSKRTLLWAALATALWGLPAASAAAQHADYARLEAYGAFGFDGDAAGRADLPLVGSVRSTGGFEPSYGFGIRHTTPMGENFALAGLFEAVTMQPTVNYGSASTAFDRTWFFDFSVMPQVRFLIPIDDFVLEPYVGFPIGFTFALAENLDDTSSPHGDEPWPGFNAGAMAGLRFLTDLRVGAFVEAGWRHHQVWSRYSLGSTSYEVNFTGNQFALNAGFVWLY